MNFVLSNTDRSQQRDPKNPTYFSHMFPVDAVDRIRSVNILFNDAVRGLHFFDKDSKLLFKIGYNKVNLGIVDTFDQTIIIAEDERIVGIRAKLHAPAWQSIYTDLQFILAKFV